MFVGWFATDLAFCKTRSKCRDLYIGTSGNNTGILKQAQPFIYIAFY